jgi:methyl-accepting chemotaxis protein WspA
MKHWTVRRRTILCFSAVMVIMIVLSLFAYERLAAIQTQATDLQRDYVPSLYLAGRLQAASIQTYASVHQHVLEHDPARMQQLLTYIQQKSAETTDILTQHDALLGTREERTLAEATKAALAPYLVARTDVLGLSADPRTKPQAGTLLRDQLDPLYTKLQDAINAEVETSYAGAAAASTRIGATVISTQRAILGSLLIGVILSLMSGYLLIHAINRSIAKLIAAVTVTRTGNQQQLSTANEIAATTSEIGATSQEISSTSKELVRT